MATAQSSPAPSSNSTEPPPPPAAGSPPNSTAVPSLPAPASISPTSPPPPQSASPPESTPPPPPSEPSAPPPQYYPESPGSTPPPPPKKPGSRDGAPPPPSPSSNSTGSPNYRAPPSIPPSPPPGRNSTGSSSSSPPSRPSPSGNSTGSPSYRAPSLRPPAPPSGDGGSRSQQTPSGGRQYTTSPSGYTPPSADTTEAKTSAFPSTSAAVGIGMAAALVAIFLVVALVLTRRKKEKGWRRGYHGDYIVPTPNGSSQMSGSPYSMGSSMPFVKGTSSPPERVTSGSYMPSSSSDSAMANNKLRFSYEELAEITDGFSSRNLLGHGGFGCVYKGQLSPSSRDVAVKQLKIGGSQGEREFQAEVEIISRVHHRHLVSLVGYCVEGDHRILVYDYVPNRTLHYHLHGRGRTVMDWATRIKVAAGAARGLAYLHEDCHPRIIHRDIKSSNILLDNNFEALVSDFGLAKLSVDTNTHVSTRVMGTFGYLAPEYASTGKLTDKSDVFSFGVVLLELITGRKPIDASRTMGDESLVEWARPLMIQALETGKFDGLPDPSLEKNYNEGEMFRMIEAASACIRYNATMRPKMGRVMRALDNLADGLDLNNGVNPGQTQMFTGQPSADDMKNFHKMAFGSQDYSGDFSRGSWNQKQL